MGTNPPTMENHAPSTSSHHEITPSHTETMMQKMLQAIVSQNAQIQNLFTLVHNRSDNPPPRPRPMKENYNPS